MVSQSLRQPLSIFGHSLVGTRQSVPSIFSYSSPARSVGWSKSKVPPQNRQPASTLASSVGPRTVERI